MHPNPTTITATTPAATVASTAATTAPKPAAADVTGTRFDDHLAASMSPPPARPIKGDVDGDGKVSPIEKTVQHIRDMIDQLQALLIMLASSGELTEAQRQRINTAMTRLSNLAGDAEAAIAGGDPPKEKDLLALASEIMSEAMKTDAQPPNPDVTDGHLPSPAAKQHWRELRARLEAATSDAA